MSKVRLKFLKDFYERQAATIHHQEEMYYKGDLLGRQRFLEVANVITKSNPCSILDVGCAEGLYVSFFKKMKPRDLIVGIDIALNYVKKAKQNTLKGEYILCHAENLPFAESSFDAILCTEVLEHLIDPRACFDELLRVCKNMVVITTPGHTLWYYLALKLWPIHLITLRTKLLPRKPFEPTCLGSGHITEISLNDLIRWCLETKSKIVKTKIGLSLALPLPLPTVLQMLITKFPDFLINLLPPRVRVGVIQLIVMLTSNNTNTSEDEHAALS